MLNPSDSIVDWVLKTVPTMGAGWCPPGMLGIGIGGTAEKAMLLAKEALMEPIDMYELQQRARPEDKRGTAHRALRQGQRARHRRAGPRRPDHRARRQDQGLPDARGEPAGRDDPQLRRDAPRALRARRQRPGLLEPPSARPLADVTWTPTRTSEARRPRHADEGRVARAGSRARRAAAQRQAAHRPRRRAQAHRQDMLAKGEKLPVDFTQPRHLLRRPGRSGARRSRRPRRPDHGDAHGQVHRDDARADRPDRDGRQGRARPGRRSRRSASTRRPT
jgi:fumarate hydratase class I